jgi:predicted GH43/DUF377 family glycosyl hydrolase
MQRQPLNATKSFDIWPSFSPGEWLDFNPTVLTMADGNQVAFIRRDKVPPVPGEGSIWSVPVDESLRPIGTPNSVVARGEDPRAVMLGGRLFLFYVVIEKDAAQRILGSCVMLAELTMTSATPSVISSYRLPKNPTGNPELKDITWEKNWVPFVVDNEFIGLIYEHSPWTVLLLNIATQGSAPKLVTAYKGQQLAWAYGEIRGGTTPLKYDDDTLITFFHSSQVIGSRNVYMVGACLFSNTAPYSPIAMTAEPLLIAPYRSTAMRFGWNVLASVIFPLGSSRSQNGFRLLCGIDDGEVGSFNIAFDTLSECMKPVPVRPNLSIVTSQSGSMEVPDGPVLFTPYPAQTKTQIPLARFLGMLPFWGGTYLDVGTAEGVYIAYLSQHFSRVVATEVVRSDWLLRNIAANGIQNLEIDSPLNEADSNPWNLRDVTLLRISSPNQVEIISKANGLIQECKPVILIDLQGSAPENQLLETTLSSYGYTVEHLFPITPQVIICTMPAHRKSCLWLR